MDKLASSWQRVRVASNVESSNWPEIVSLARVKNWTSFIYKSKLIRTGRTLSGTAVEVCTLTDPVELIFCDMVYKDSNYCHYGNFSNLNGTLTQPSGVSWDVYIKKGEKLL